MWQKFLASFRRYMAIWILFGLMLCGSGYYLWLHRRPFTQNAFVVANIRVVNALVPGYISQINVKNNQRVVKDQVLMTIYRPVYDLQQQSAEHALQAQIALVAKLEFACKVAETAVESAQATAANAQYLSERAVQMYAQLAVSQAYSEEKLRAYESAMAQLTGAKHNLNVAKSELQQAQATVKKLEADYKLAQIYYQWTEVKAQSDGFVSNMYTSPGGYVAVGTPLFAFVDDSVWYIQANFKETELSQIQVGQKALIWLWQYPGKTFHGTVLDIGWGVERREQSSFTGMPVVQKENEWFLLPQRFPVQIRIDDPDENFPLHSGGSAFVAVDTPAYPFRQFIWQLFQI
ncbi:MAG: HlyD family secretion protein [Victivallaceae bacterium]